MKNYKFQAANSPRVPKIKTDRVNQILNEMKSTPRMFRRTIDIDFSDPEARRNETLL